MGFLKDRRVYLCGSITALSDDGFGWRQAITPKLQEIGLVVDDPTILTFDKVGEVAEHKAYFKNLVKERKFEQLKKDFYPIVKKDLRFVDHSDFLICSYDPDLHLVGTIHELVVASWQKKPILLYVEESKLD